MQVFNTGERQIEATKVCHRCPRLPSWWFSYTVLLYTVTLGFLRGVMALAKSQRRGSITVLSRDLVEEHASLPGTSAASPLPLIATTQLFYL